MYDKNTLSKNAYRLLILLALLTFFGCSSPLMKVAPAGFEAPKPDQDQALIVFLRPSVIGSAFQSSVFNITQETKPIAVVSYGAKVPYLVKAGKIELMVIGENADFLKGNLEAGKTYFVLVAPRMGLMKARFSLRAIAKQDLTEAKTQKWISEGKWSTPLQAKFDEWVQKNQPSIKSKRKKYYLKWETKAEKDKPTLLPEDGMM